MDSKTVDEILKNASEIEKRGYLGELAKSLVIGRMFHNSSHRERQVVDLAMARLGCTSVDLSWQNLESMETSSLYNEVTMNSECVDLLITAISSNEMFGEGRTLTMKLPEYSSVPVISLHDDLYNWQSALSHLHGIKKQLKSLRGKRLAISWVYGSTFTNPSLAHSLILTGILSGASIRVVTPSDFPVLGRVRKEGLELTKDSDTELEFTHDFKDAFVGVDAIIPFNWFRLDNFNHPERNQEYAQAYQDWFLREDLVPEGCLISTEPDIQSELSITPELFHSAQVLSHSWLSNRVTTLAATIKCVLGHNNTEHIAAVV